MKKILFILPLLLILSGAGCIFKNRWQGFYYPDGCLACEENYIYSPIYNSLEECRNWADNLKSKRNNPNDLYECGKNCKEKNGFNVCDETID